MYAATKPDCMEYVIWEGLNANYPGPYYQYIHDSILEDEFRHCHFVTEEGFVVELVESVAVFLITKRKKIKLLELSDLDIMGVRLTSRHFAMYEDCFLYFISDGCYGVAPDWFMKNVEYGLIYRHDGIWMFYDESGEIAMSPSCVFIWNGKKNDLYYLETEDFKDMCIYKRY